MFTCEQIQFNHLATRLAHFYTLINSIRGVVNMDDVTFEVKVNSKALPDLVSLKLTRGTFTIQYKEDVQTFPTLPTPQELIKALNDLEAAYLEAKMLSTLVHKLARDGYVYIAAITPKLLDVFLKVWSDAYGEDNPEVFMKKHSNGSELFGFVRTNLLDDDIAARNNEDGDDDYHPEPLFKNMKEA